MYDSSIIYNNYTIINNNDKSINDMKKKIFAVAFFAAVLGGGLSAYGIYRFAAPVGTDIVQNKEKGKITTSDKTGYTFASEQMRQEGFPDLTYAAEKSVPAVVNIDKREIVTTDGGIFFNDPFLEMFGFPQGYSQPQEQERRSGGSGVIISQDGYIVTNNHVVENASTLKVTLSDERSFDAKLIGTDPTTDIALIKIEAEGLPVIPFGDSESLRLGEWVIAVGNPYGLTSTVTAGIVSAKGRNLDVIPDQFRLESFIQTDAAVNPGNSGGALVNTAGSLIGINTVIKSPTGSYAGYSFAVPSNMVKKVVVDLMEYGFVQRAIMGIGYSEINDDFIEARGEKLGITEKGGLYVGTVDEKGAAAEAGIKVGDVIVAIDGVHTDKSSSLQAIIAERRPNDTITVDVKRDGKVKQFKVVLRNKAGEAKLLDKNSVDVVASLGGKFADLNDKAKSRYKLSYGVQVTEVNGGILKRAGVRPGYIITHINGVAIRSTTDLNRITNAVQTIDGMYPDGRYVSYSIVSADK